MNKLNKSYSLSSKASIAIKYAFLSFLCTSILLLVSINTFAQSHTVRCGTKFTPEQVVQLRKAPYLIKPNFVSNSNDKTTASLTDVYVQFHFITNASGNYKIANTDITSALAVLNNKYHDAGLNFVTCGPNLIEHDFSQYYNFPTPNTPSCTQALLTISRHDRQHAINIYIVNSILNGASGGSDSKYGGFAGSCLNDEEANIVLAYQTAAPLSTNLHIELGIKLCHEMGHFWGLEHMNGSNPEGYTDEYVNGSNSNSAGDGIDDTPADPAADEYWNSDDCIYPDMPTGLFFDPCLPTAPKTQKFCDTFGKIYVPLADNIMFNFASNTCNTSFTPHQLQRVYNNFNDTAYKLSTRYDGREELITRDNELDAGYEGSYGIGDIWHSPDLWNCRNTINCPSEENPGYQDPTKYNYLNVLVRNIGCTTSQPAELHTYWTLGSTGETWDNSWNGATFICNQIAGDEIPTPNSSFYGQIINPIAAGDSDLFTFPWKPITPDSFQCTNLENDVDGYPMICYLSRIVSPTDSITYFKTQINKYVAYNNKVATRNSSLIDLPGNRPKHINWGNGGTIYIKNPNNTNELFDLHFAEVLNNHNYYENGNVIIKLSNELWESCLQSGFSGVGFTIYDSSKHQIKITEPDAILSNIQLFANGLYQASFTFYLNSETAEYEQYHFAFYQSMPQIAENSIGSTCTFQVNINNSEGAFTRQSNLSKPSSDLFDFYPNPTTTSGTLEMDLLKTGNVSIDLTSTTGSQIKSLCKNQNYSAGKHTINFNTEKLNNGIYFLKINTLTSSQTIKIVVAH